MGYTNFVVHELLYIICCTWDSCTEHIVQDKCRPCCTDNVVHGNVVQEIMYSEQLYIKCYTGKCYTGNNVQTYFVQGKMKTTTQAEK